MYFIFNTENSVFQSLVQ